MASYEKPTANLAAFNNLVFTDANDESLTLSKAKSLFLGRTGTPNSTATVTTFTGDINADNLYSTNINNATLIESNYYDRNLAAYSGGYCNLFTNAEDVDTIQIGSTVSTTDLRGSELNVTATTTTFSNATNITNLSSTNITNSNDIFSNLYLRNLASSNSGFCELFTNAESTDAIEIGNTNSSTYLRGQAVYITATTTNITNDIYVNGVRAGAGKYRPVADVSMNTCFGRDALGATLTGIMNTAFGNTALAALNTGSDNTAVGNKALNALTSGIRNVAVGANSLVAITTGSRNTSVGQATGQLLATTASDNTFTGYIAGGATTSGQSNTYLGANAGSNYTTGSFNTHIGGFAGHTANSTVSSTTLIGYKALSNFASSTAIGGGNATTAGATCTAANQIMLGRTTEFVECAGTDATNGSLKLNGGLILQSTYSSTPSSNMLGFRITLSAVAISTITSLTSLTFGSLALTAGVWSLDYTVELSAGTAVTATAQSFYFSNASGASATYSTRIANTGTTRIHSSNSYASGDTPAFSGGGMYYTSSAITLYPAVLINYTGTLTGTGWASATRIG